MSDRKPQKNPAQAPKRRSSRRSNTYITWVFTPPAGQSHGASASAGSSTTANQALLANRNAAEVALNNFEDAELQAVLRRHYHEIADTNRPTMVEVRNRAANLFGVVGRPGRGLSIRDAVILLARAEWDANRALRQYMHNVRPTLAGEIEVTQNPPPKGAKVVVEDDGDDELPLPTNVEEVILNRPDLPANTKAVFHHQIRRYLIERDIRRYGNYRHERTKGEVFEDQTAPHPQQLRWGFDDQNQRRQMPAILFRYKKAGYQDQESSRGIMRWRGHVVVDIDRYPLMDFTNIPSTLSSKVEGGLLEAIERLNSQVKHQDLSARIFSPQPLALPSSQDLKARDNRLSQAMRRFRESEGIVTWKSPPGGEDAYQKWVNDNLPAHRKAQNTTVGFGPLSSAKILEIKGQSIGKFPKRSKSGDPAKRQKYLTEHNTRLKRLQKKNVEASQGFDPEKALKKFDFISPTADLTEPIADADSESTTDSKSEPDHDGPDSRYDTPENAEEEAALHDAMLPTILHFLDVTGELPVIGRWDASYVIILHVLDRQLNEWAERQRVPRVELVGYGFWTGGIMNAHSARLEATPLVTKLAEFEQKKELKKKRQTEVEEHDGEEDKGDEGDDEDEDEMEHSAQSDA